MEFFVILRHLDEEREAPVAIVFIIAMPRKSPGYGSCARSGEQLRGNLAVGLNGQFECSLLPVPGHFFDPDIIVLGGGVSYAGEFLLNNVAALLPRYQMFKALPIPKLALAKLGNEAGIVGAEMLGK